MLISCIIPTRNRPDYVQTAVRSVLAQSHSDIELLIVNDGATPVSTIDDTRVRILNSHEQGAVSARNLGVVAAQGDVMAWLDDDDVWTDQNFLATCLARFASGADFIYGDGALVFPDGARRPFAQHADADTLTRDNTILVSAICYRRSLHAGLGLFDDALPYYWDWDWYLRVARSGARLSHVATPVVDIRIHAGNMSGDARAAERAANLQSLIAKHGLGHITLKSHADFA